MKKKLMKILVAIGVVLLLTLTLIPDVQYFLYTQSKDYQSRLLVEAFATVADVDSNDVVIHDYDIENLRAGISWKFTPKMTIKGVSVNGYCTQVLSDPLVCYLENGEG